MSPHVSRSDLETIKAKSEAEARRLGYPTLDWLPFVVDEGEIVLRSRDEVVDRALVMTS